jgi:two-component system cell cycle sensor histidine kinase/response regulator CckA
VLNKGKAVFSPLLNGGKNMINNPIRVFLIEDDHRYADLIGMFLARGRDTQFELERSDRLLTGLDRLREEEFDLVLLDLNLPDSGGLETFLQTYKQVPQLPIIILTGNDDETLAVKAVHMGAQDYLVKGDANGEHLIRSIRYAIERKRSEELLRKAHDELENRVEERTRKLREINESLKREIAERKRIEEALAAEKERLTVTLRSIGDGVIATDTEGRIVLMNKVAEQITGWQKEEAMGRSFAEVFSIIKGQNGEASENPVERTIQMDQIVYLPKDAVLVARDGGQKFVSATSSPIHDRDSNIVGVVLVFRDITERKKIEEELLKAQKLESIGVLAGGLAHDFNNLLTVMLGNISLSKVHLDTEDKIYARLSEAEKACFRARDLTKQLLTFSKGGAPVKKITSVMNLLRESIDFTPYDPAVRYELSVEGNLWPAEIDEGQIIQVIKNLLLNAEESMPDGGLIKVSAQNITNEDRTVNPDHLGRYVKITIQDQGVGISEEHLSKIFDPYFTTKKGAGGLGLAVVYSIIRNHHGYVEVETDKGSGTKFHVYLPASVQELQMNEDKLFKGPLVKKKVLIMDDEEIVREASGEVLAMLGYEVDYAGDGKEAIQKYRSAKEAGEQFDLVIMDLTVPGGMGGKEALEELRRIDPNVKAIVSSGYSNDPVMSDYRKYGFDGVVAKPYKIEELTKVVKKVMEN